MIKTFKYRIYPTRRQERVLNDQLAVCCELYNAALQERREAWERARKSISYFDQSLQVTQVRAIRDDVRRINARVLHNVVKRVDLAFAAFFRRVKNGERPGYPRFRTKRRYDSLTYQQTLKTALRVDRLRLQGVGIVRVRVHRPLEGQIKTLTIKREAGRWFALFCVDYAAVSLPFNANAIGIDVGLSSFATLSNGTVIENPRWHRKAEAKLRRLQRRVARRKRGSNRRRKAVMLLRRFHHHIRDQRQDFHHKQSRKIIDANGLIAVEDLNIKGLARTRLGKSVQDAGWSTFLFMLAYKAESAGRVFVKVDPRGTSQTCLCGADAPKTLAVRKHQCDQCGLVGERDHISAQIILARCLPSGVNVGDLMPSVA